MSLWRTMSNKFLDSSIYFSFDRSGYERHASYFKEVPLLAHQHIVITGCNTGIGYACARQLIEKGASVTLLCRDSDKSERAYQTLQSYRPKYISDTLQKITLLKVDLNDQDALVSVAQRITTPVHGLIHNAGLLPRSLLYTKEGFELTRGIHLVAAMRLTWYLMPALIAGSKSWLTSPHSSSNLPLARIIFVSSGGMYTQKLSPHYFNSTESENRYDGVVSYAKSKRAQVELTHILQDHMPVGIDVQSMHPGWVNTTGVQDALPQFWQWTHNRLRTPSQGADTLTWLMSLPRQDQAKFWFDRQARQPYLLGKRCQPEARQALWKDLADAIDVPVEAWRELSQVN